MHCSICTQQLRGRQKLFCSIKCKNKSINSRHKNYLCQQKRGLSRKKQLIVLLGGKCSMCGYNKNFTALEFHHLHSKLFGIDIRQCSNRSWKTLTREAKKCTLLCSNCHRELHHPDCQVGYQGFEPWTNRLCLPLRLSPPIVRGLDYAFTISNCF